MKIKSHKLFDVVKPKPAPAPEPTMPLCIFCKKTRPGKIYMEGVIMEEGEIVWRFKGVVHHACADRATEKERARR